MTFIKACSRAIVRAKITGGQYYVARDSNGDYHASKNYKQKWLFMAYPGGRKQLSTDGVKLAESLGIALET